MIHYTHKDLLYYRTICHVHLFRFNHENKKIAKPTLMKINVFGFDEIIFQIHS